MTTVLAVHSGIRVATRREGPHEPVSDTSQTPKRANTQTGRAMTAAGLSSPDPELHPWQESNGRDQKIGVGTTR